MTLRGAMKGFGRTRGYQELPKILNIQLLQSTMIWNKQIVIGHDGQGTRKLMSKVMDGIRDAYRIFSDRQFIYFIATRQRVRIAGTPYYDEKSNILYIPVEIGPEKTSKEVKLPASFLKTFRFRKKTEIKWSPTHISFINETEIPVLFSIHDLLEIICANLGLHSTIMYVGKTKNPGRRVIKGDHRGLSDTLTYAQESGEDVFIYTNTFHGRFHATSADGGIQFVVSNSYIDEIEIDPEADLIEKLLIYYFEPVTQQGNRSHDLSILKNTMQRLRNEKSISAVEISFSVNYSSDYYHLSRASSDPKEEHSFRCCLENGELSLTL